MLHAKGVSGRYESNIRNLTDLWVAMGAQLRAIDGGPTLYASEGWPHRLWFDVEQRPSRAEALRLIDVSQGSARPFLLPVWSEQTPRSSGDLGLGQELSAAGYRVQFDQTVMTLDLQGWRTHAGASDDIELRWVTRATSAWAAIASKAFGYTVEEQVTDRILQEPGAALMTAVKDGRAVGTGLIFAGGEVAGIHMVGVLPEFRRMGIARKIMVQLLDQAHSRGLRFATLQASAMGEGLYRELGLGLIRNFSK